MTTVTAVKGALALRAPFGAAATDGTHPGAFLTRHDS